LALVALLLSLLVSLGFVRFASLVCVGAPPVCKVLVA